MKRESEEGRPVNEPGFQVMLTAKIRQLGFDGIMSFATAFPTASLNELAKNLKVAPIQLHWKFVDEGKQRNQIRLYAKELLTRLLWSNPNGWSERSNEDAHEDMMHQLVSWEADLQEIESDTFARSIVMHLLDARDIPSGWQPGDSEDPRMLALFDKYWPNSQLSTSESLRMAHLYAAARRGDAVEVAALLDRGADPNETGDEHGTTALTIAAGQGHVEVVRLLLERGADVDQPNKFGARPLFVAATNAKREVIRLLLKAGASLSLEADSGLTPFMKAAKSMPETVRVFLEHGVDVNAVSSKGFTALQCAAINDLYGPAVIPMLLEAGAAPSYRDSQGRTAKDLALERGREKNAAVLDAHIPSPRSENSPKGAA